jgi:hypothetical protein
VTISIRVPGAADSGHRFATDAQQSPKADWTCSRGHACKGYWTRCLTLGCNEKRSLRKEGH